MSPPNRRRWTLLAALVAALAFSAGQLKAQAAYNPFHAYDGWDQLPSDMEFGAFSGAFPDPDGEHMWMLSRCGGNICAGSERNPILKTDMDGNVVDSFGAGLFGFAHGFFLDHEGYLWVTEGAPDGDDRAEPGYELGLGHQVHKLNQEGEVVMSLGEAAVHGCDEAHFNGPSDVAVDSDGNIWIVDGHRGGNNRLVKFSPDGEFLLERGGCVGDESREPGMFNDPHGLAIDSQDRIFVADRGNSRIQIFDQDGNLEAIWTQFGKPSGIFIDQNDVLYVVDGLSGAERPGWRDNPGWVRGIRIGDATTGWVTAFIPNTTEPAGAGIEFIGVDFDGNLYTNDLARVDITKYVRYR